MRIYFLLSWYKTNNNPHAGVFFYQQAKAIQNKGHEVVLLYADILRIKRIFSRGIKFPNIIEVNENGIPLIYINSFIWIPRLKNSGFLFRTHAFNKIIKRAIKKFGKPDIIHAQSCLWAGVAGAVSKKKYDIPLIITEHSSAFHMNKVSNEGLNWARFGFNASDRNIFVSKRLQSDVCSRISINKKGIVIPNLIDNSVFNCNRKRTGKFKFLTIAGLNPIKTIDVLINSFSYIVDENKDIQLEIVGDGPEKSKLEKLASELGLKDKIIFYGQVAHKEVYNKLSDCDVFVLPSEYETFGVVLIEALACGKPVISTKCGGPEDIVNGRNGILVEVDNVVELANAMKYMYYNYSSYDNTEIRKEAIRNYSSEAIGKRIIDVYIDVLKGYNREK